MLCFGDASQAPSPPPKKKNCSVWDISCNSNYYGLNYTHYKIHHNYEVNGKIRAQTVKKSFKYWNV